MQEWETENFEKILGWISEWDVKEGYKIITFSMKDKTRIKFEIKL